MRNPPKCFAPPGLIRLRPQRPTAGAVGYRSFAAPRLRILIFALTLEVAATYAFRSAFSFFSLCFAACQSDSNCSRLVS